MRKLVLVLVLLMSSALPSAAQPDADPRARWAQFMRDSLPNIRGALWQFKVVSNTLSRLDHQESGGRIRLSLAVRLQDIKCLDPALDFENPPNLGTTRIKGFSVGYRKGAAPTLSQMDACASLTSGSKKRYLRVTTILNLSEDRDFVESALAAIYDAAIDAPALVDKAVTASAEVAKEKDAELQRLEGELGALLRQPRGDELAQRRLDALNRQAMKNAKVVQDQDLGGVIFAAVSWRMWLDNPSGVPAAEVADDETPPVFDRMGQAWNIQVGALRGNYFGSASVDLYAGDVREGASPGIYQLVAGMGSAGRSWAEGGIAQTKTYKYELLTQYGDPCPEWDDGKDESINRAKFRGVKCNKTRVTETTHNLSYPAGWVMGWAGAYGGWRYAHDMLAGDSGDAMRPLGSSGGPVVGLSGFFRRGAYAFETSHELAFYAHGSAASKRPAYNGRVAFGAILALMELRWRLDSDVGSEFMFGLQLRADLFSGVGFWSD